MTYRPSVTIIGAGNVATHLAMALSRVVSIREIWSRNAENAAELAHRVGGSAVAVSRLDALTDGSDFYIVSVVDDAVGYVIDNTPHLTSGIWTHTSGSTPMSVFAGKKSRYGVFYPLQTFSKQKAVDVADVPMLIEGCDEGVAERLMALASLMSRFVRAVDSDGRARLHIAAVFACNFVNYMWTIADEQLRKSSLTIDVLMPLLGETLDKLRVMSPYDAQTGPARRGDINIIDRHASMLDEDIASLYTQLSERILRLYNK